ncbi:polymer-forming cytoskeletal protein [Haloprofundus salilacus]|uniref:polymer-forming cytoskeletal protein n=1 Tax=Haloprofundus salilacus TaxID=2876190 RepID=UPI001CD03044|nr:polymer-forming cytoskeletal protein [Haloprofundus salilacus]
MNRNTRSVALVVLAVVVALAAVPGVATAITRSGDTVVVAEDETVDELNAFGGSVVVRGTVNGNVSALAGDVYVADTGRVGGNVAGAAGAVRIAGSVEGDVAGASGSLTLEEGSTVGGDVAAGTGSLTVAEGATVRGDLSAGAQTASINGTVEGDAEIDADEILLGSAAVIEGDLTYDGTLQRADGAVVNGTVEREDDLATAAPVGTDGPLIPGWTFAVYGLLLNLLLGAILLFVFPSFSQRVVLEAARSPGLSGGVGLLSVVVVPLVLLLLVLTLVGIPLALVGSVLFGLLVWVGGVYGRFAVGAVILAYTDREGEWVALLVGVLVVGLVVQIPVLGWVVNLAVGLVGLGALVLALSSGYRRRRAERTPTPDVGAVS